MKIADHIVIALNNLKAGKQMVKKIVFGMMVIQILIICFVTILVSYFDYQEIFQTKHISDCYYYLTVEEQELSPEALERIVDDSRRLGEKYSVKDVMTVCDVRSIDETMEQTAEKIKMVFDGEIHEAGYTQIIRSQANFYRNVLDKFSTIDFAAFDSGMKILPEQLEDSHGKAFLVGEYPQHPGEIMLDDYILSVYGFKDSYDDLIGKPISFWYYDGEKKESLFKDYTLTGVFDSGVLPRRENIYTSDLHIEHIYVNVKEEDMNHFYVTYGSSRCYFDDYMEYVSNYDYAGSLLKLDMDDMESGEAEVALTSKGMEYCIMYYFMENVGKLLIIIAGVTALIITLSILYIFKFYTDRQKNYRLMLSYIGMENRDSKRVFLVELLVIFLLSSVLAIYFSVIFLLLLNYLTSMLLDFTIAINIKNCVLSVLCSWLYFAVCRKGLEMFPQSI